MLLLHGFGDTPQTLHYLARYLHERGYDVRVPLLPGHGRSISDFNATSHAAWLDAARAELFAMRARYDSAALGGLSMGGALAAIIAADIPRLPALLLIAPYLAMPRYMRWMSATHRLWSGPIGPIRTEAPHSIRDPLERVANLSYGAVTGRAVHELAMVVREGRRALPRVTAPTLLIQSDEDNRISPHSAREAFSALGCRAKKLVFTSGAGHIITVDYGRERVFEEVRAWLESGPGTTSQPGHPG